MLAAAVPARAEIACFSGPMPARALPMSGVAGSGGIVVGSGEAMPDWRFRAGNRVVRGEVTVIAPGLALYHPPPAVPGVDLVLESKEHAVQAEVQRVLVAPPPVAPPTVEAVTWRTNEQRRVQVSARLAQEAPAHAFLVIVSRVDGKRLVPLSWGMVNGPVRVLDLWHTPGSCEGTIPQSIPPSPAEIVVLSWVDDTGRVSEPSKPIVISRGK